jgi:hypothetical protein
MKKLILIFLFTVYGYSQTVKLICIDKNKSFAVCKKENKLFVYSDGLAICQNENEITFTFDDNSKFKIMSFNDYNCDGLSIFYPFKKQWALFKKKVISIELLNGITRNSILYILTDSEQSFFIDNYGL